MKYVFTSWGSDDLFDSEQMHIYDSFAEAKKDRDSLTCFATDIKQMSAEAVESKRQQYRRAYERENKRETEMDVIYSDPIEYLMYQDECGNLS